MRKTKQKIYTITLDTNFATDILSGTGWTLNKNSGAQELAAQMPKKAWFQVLEVLNSSAAPSCRLTFDDGITAAFRTVQSGLILTPYELPALCLEELRTRPRLYGTWAPDVTTVKVLATWEDNY